MKTGEKIRHYRKLKKLTQSDIAESLNISQRAYSKIENDEVNLKIDRLEEIARILSIEAKDLLPGVPYQMFDKVSYSQIGSGQFINQTSDKERDLFEKIIKRQQDEIDYLKGIVSVFNK